jgi:hypothetical protein
MTTAIIAHVNDKAVKMIAADLDPEFIFKGLTVAAVEDEGMLEVDTTSDTSEIVINITDGPALTEVWYDDNYEPAPDQYKARW